MIQQSQFFAVFNSAHKVMKAESILKKNALAILLIPAPRALSTDCGLAIRYNSDLYDTVFQTLMNENLLPDVIYQKESDSQYVTIWIAETGDPTAT
jgi:hypothetical protein